MERQKFWYHHPKLHQFVRKAFVPLALLVFIISFNIFYQLLNLPSSDQVLSTVERAYQNYGYWVVFVGALMEGALFINWYLPGSLIIVIGVVLAKQNTLNLGVVIALVVLGFFVGAIYNYCLGRYGWYHLFARFGLDKPLATINKRVAKNGLPIIFLTYFHPNIGALVATSAGVLKLPFLPFALYSLVALTAWNTLWGLVVYTTGPLVLQVVGNWVTILALSAWVIYIGAKALFSGQKS